jgi:hypothetical protein
MQHLLYVNLWSMGGVCVITLEPELQPSMAKGCSRCCRIDRGPRVSNRLNTLQFFFQYNAEMLVRTA